MRHTRGAQCEAGRKDSHGSYATLQNNKMQRACPLPPTASAPPSTCCHPPSLWENCRRCRKSGSGQRRAARRRGRRRRKFFRLLRNHPRKMTFPPACETTSLGSSGLHEGLSRLQFSTQANTITTAGKTYCTNNEPALIFPTNIYLPAINYCRYYGDNEYPVRHRLTGRGGTNEPNALLKEADDR